ncbi:FAD:protein FMN transferase [Comamonadaceae bacterium OH2545_COT-014]|nr:FAD:protein FMN transferase [Comamonadaceae bacterium OH2545_COT-014]
MTLVAEPLLSFSPRKRLAPGPAFFAWGAVYGAACLAAALLTACQRPPPVERLSGPTMGSTFHISYVQAPGTPQAAALLPQVQDLLARLDRAVSTYRPDSDLARFNAAPAGACLDMPAEAIALARHAQQLAAQGEGAYDITLLPVLDAWGFGPRAATARQALTSASALAAAQHATPTPDALERLRPRIGQRHLRIDGARLCKDAPIQIDFNSIAAGYAVDGIAELLTAQGIASYLIEVTGEIRGAGRKPDGAPWRVAIEAPLDSQRQAQKIVPLDGLSLSTSGDYRHYREAGGQRLSHMIDARTLRPVTHRLAAVTVATPSALQADGLSTLLMALGPQQGFDYAVRHNLAALFVTRTAQGFDSRPTPAFEARFPSTPPKD